MTHRVTKRSSKGRFSIVAAALPFLVASKCKTKEPEVVEPVVIEAAPPEVELQVVSVEPRRVEEGKSFRAAVYGSAFEDGAQVWVGATSISSVQFRDENTLAISVPPIEAGAHDVQVKNPDGESATLRNGILAKSVPKSSGLDCDMFAVYFELDSERLDPSSQATLEQYMPCFDEHKGTVRVEGHCDERGTTDYNLALGQRRADSIERWLVNKGVVPSRVRTISYGEERPKDLSHDEDAWAANRRVEIKVAD